MESALIQGQHCSRQRCSRTYCTFLLFRYVFCVCNLSNTLEPYILYMLLFLLTRYFFHRRSIPYLSNTTFFVTPSHNPIYIYYYLHVSNHKISHQFISFVKHGDVLLLLISVFAQCGLISYLVSTDEQPAHSIPTILFYCEDKKTTLQPMLLAEQCFGFLCVFLGDIIYARD